VKRRTQTAVVKDEEPKLTKRRTWASTTAAAEVEKLSDSLSDDPSIKQVAKKRTRAAKVEEPVDEAAKLKREQCLEKLRQYYHANRETVCKK